MALMGRELNVTAAENTGWSVKVGGAEALPPAG